MIDLDARTTYERLDPQRMGDRIADMGNQIRQARRLAAAFPHPGSEYRQARNIVVLGMGGSAIGADLVRSLADDQITVPMVASRDYRCPAFVGPDSLVIASSYSGNTEETLSAVQDALSRGARVMALTTGGSLAMIAQRNGLPVLQFQYEAQPRAAMGFSFGLLLGVLSKLGYLDESRLGVEEALTAASSIPLFLGSESPAESNPAKQMALRLYGKLPVVYGAGILSEVARRWKGQFNENAKAWAFFEQLPELNHNAVVGYENPAELGAGVHVVLLSSSHYHPRVAARIRVTADILRDRGVSHEVVEARGRGAMAQMLDAVMTGDYVTYYLALLYESDPTPVRAIDFLKQELAGT